jgi:hypothetical protein
VIKFCHHDRKKRSFDLPADAMRHRASFMIVLADTHQTPGLAAGS